MLRKLLNKLNTIQQVSIRGRDGKEYSMFIEANKATSIENYQITNDIINKVAKGSLAFIDELKEEPATERYSTGKTVKVDPIKIEPIEEETPVEGGVVVEGVVEETVEETTEESVPEDTATSSKYVCDVCGNEFASKRGLDSHKARSHK